MITNVNGQKFQEFNTLRASKDIKGVKLVLKPTENGQITFQMARQNGFNQNGLPTFDYNNSFFFVFSDIEIASIVRAIEKQFRNFDLNTGVLVKELTFSHLNAKKPKNIKIAFSVYNEQLQCRLSCYPQYNNEQPISIYLNEAETECLKEVCKCQYSFSLARAIAD